jgi:hypothetical protein
VQRNVRVGMSGAEVLAAQCACGHVRCGGAFQPGQPEYHFYR